MVGSVPSVDHGVGRGDRWHHCLPRRRPSDRSGDDIAGSGGDPVIGLCTDSGSQLPAELIERFGIEVVPVTIAVDGHEYLDGVDIGADDFYARLGRDPRPIVTVAPPSPGQFALAYDELVDRGATEILSIHVGSAHAATLNSARLGGRQVPVPIRFVDTGLASFGVGCCVWAAAEALASGADLERAALAAENIVSSVGHVLVAGELDVVRATGRANTVADGPGVPVLSFIDGELRVLERVATTQLAAEVMARRILAWEPDSRQINVAIGIADREGWRLSLAIERLVSIEPRVREILRYRIGPSLGARAGAGTASAPSSCAARTLCDGSETRSRRRASESV
jgi:DegV family protein with EDD domain